MELKKSGFAQSVALLFFFDNFTKVVVFLRSAVITAKLGFGLVTDVFNFAQSIVNTPISLVSDALLAGLIPFLNSKQSVEEKRNLAYSTILVLLIFILILSIVFFTIRKPLLRVIAVGFGDQSYSTILFYSFFFVIIGAIGIFTRVVEGFLRTEQVFGVSNRINLLGSIVGLCGLWIFLDRSENVLVYSLLGGAFVVLWGYILIAPKGKFLFDRSVFKMLLFAVPLIFSASLGIINNVIDKSFATLVSRGGLTALTYSFLLAQQLALLVGSPLLGASFTFISRDITEGNIENLNSRLRDSICILGFFLSLATGCFIFLGNPALSILYKYGKVGETEIGELFSLTSIYLAPCFLSSFGGFMIQILYSYKNSLPHAIINGSMVVLHILLNLLLVSEMGAKGLALSSMLTGLIANIILDIYVIRHYKAVVLSLKDFALVGIILVAVSATCGFGLGGKFAKYVTLFLCVCGSLIFRKGFFMVITRMVRSRRSS